MHRFMGNIQKEWLGLVLFNETHRVVSDQMCRIALDVPTFKAVVPILMIMIVGGTIQVAYKFIKAMMDRIVP